jgi:hypothetical protein
MTVALPRSLAQVNRDPSLNLMNRVDVWCLDGGSLGMGKNLLEDTDGTGGAWTLTSLWEVNDTAGPDGKPCLAYTDLNLDLEEGDYGWGGYGLGLYGTGAMGSTPNMIRSELISLTHVVPVVMTAIARSRGGRVRMDLEAFDEELDSLGVCDENAETIGTDWQRLLLEWLPPADAKYIQVRLEVESPADAAVSHISVLPKELLIYRGRIEEWRPSVGPAGESVEVQLVGSEAALSNMYIDFLQYVAVQSGNDLLAGRIKHDPTDPSNMVKALLDQAVRQDPLFPIWYTSESIKSVDEIREYTFRDVQIRDGLDKILTISPPGWHWFVTPDNCLHFQGPEHVDAHLARLSVEILEYNPAYSLAELKNYIIFKGREDDANEEEDGYGTIRAVAFDQASINQYGRRDHFVSDSNVADPVTAEFYAEGTLEELNVIELSGSMRIPDEKDMRLSLTSLRGYNVQSFWPGDLLRIVDPQTGPSITFYDQAIWDQDTWDTNEIRYTPPVVKIVSINYDGTGVTVEIGNKEPSASGEYAKLQRWLRYRESGT